MLCVHYTLLGVVRSSKIETSCPTTPLTTKYGEYETSPRMYNELLKFIFIFDDLYVYLFLFLELFKDIFYIVWYQYFNW